MSIVGWFSNKFFPRKFGNTWFYPAGYNPWNKGSYYNYYSQLPELNAVINIKARAFSNAIFTGKPSDNEILRIFDKPNWYQSGNEFLMQAKLQREIFGNEYLYILKPFGMNIIKSLYVLPSENVSVEKQNKTLFFLTQNPTVTYQYRDGDKKLTLDRENVIHFTSERVAGEIEGLSPVESLLPVLNNLKMAYQSRGVILKYRGALGIVSSEARDGAGNPFPFDPKERDRIQEEYKNYGMLDGQHQLIFSNQPLRFIPMTTSPDRLGLFEEAKEALNKILDKYGVPSDLLTRQIGATYENQRQAERGFYIRTIIPEMAEWIGGINQTFGTSIEADFTQLPFFQDDIKIKNETLNLRVNMLSRMFADGAITLEEYQAEAQTIIS